MWMIPLTNKIDVTVMAGPSFFTVRQTLATVNAPQDISDVPPYTTVTITNISLTDVKDSPVGVNVGIDGNYLITTMKGVGIGSAGSCAFQVRRSICRQLRASRATTQISGQAGRRAPWACGSGSR